MRIKILASGSKGNATLIETKNTKILIDVGLSYMELRKRLALVQTDIDDISAILITHEHTDHIKGLNTYLKRHRIPVYLSNGSYHAIVKEREIGENHRKFVIIEEDQLVQFEDFYFHPFLVSHDAYEPLGFSIYEGGKKLVYLTDTGFVSKQNEERIRNADIYILETNHNVEMLMETNRPWYLKQRILSDFGHLCNEDAFNVLSRVRGESTKYVYLAHISEEANSLDLLKLSVKEYYKQEEDYRLNFFIAYQHQTSEIVEI